MAEVKTYLEALTALDEAPLAVAPGGVIFSAGDTGGEMYVVRTGSVDLKIIGDRLRIVVVIAEAAALESGGHIPAVLVNDGLDDVAGAVPVKLND